MRMRLVQLIIGLACTLIFLAIAFYRVQLGAVSAALAGADPFWAAAARLPFSLNFAVRAWRWPVILRPSPALSYPIAARAPLGRFWVDGAVPAAPGGPIRCGIFP